MIKLALPFAAALSMFGLTACGSQEAPAPDTPVDVNETAPMWADYTPAAFAAAQDEGRTIVVDVYADWCPTCKAQAPILDEVRSEPAMADAAFFKVDYDVHKDFLKDHRIPRQSTILVFDGKEEAARSIAETDRDRLRSVILDAA